MNYPKAHPQNKRAYLSMMAAKAEEEEKQLYVWTHLGQNVAAGMLYEQHTDFFIILAGGSTPVTPVMVMWDHVQAMNLAIR